MYGMITAIMFGLISAILWGTADFLSREASTSIGHYLTSSYNQLISFIWLILFGFVFNLQLPVFNSHLLAFNILLGILDFFSIVFLYRGLSNGVMSIVAPISGAYPVVTIVLAVVLLGQMLTAFNAITIAVVMMGVALSGVKFSNIRKRTVTFPQTDSKNHHEMNRRTRLNNLFDSRRLVEGLSPALVSCFTGGLLFFGLGIITPTLGWWFPSAVIKGSAALFALGSLIPLGQKFKIPSLRSSFLLLVMGVMDCLSFLTFSFGIIQAGGYLPLVVTFSGLAGLAVLILARIFYGEKLDRVQSVGVLLVLTGALTLLYFQKF